MSGRRVIGSLPLLRSAASASCAGAREGGWVGGNWLTMLSVPHTKNRRAAGASLLDPMK